MFSNKFCISFQPKLTRFMSSVVKLPETNGTINPIVTNRNPRNLERLRIARKPVGYGYDKINIEYWHKLTLDQSNRFVTASLVHNTNAVAVTASTKEWALRKFLYSPTDASAYLLLAKVFAERCLETGIINCFCELERSEGTKVDLFLKTVEEEGLTLKEPEVYNPKRIWDKIPEKKPWLVHED